MERLRNIQLITLPATQNGLTETNCYKYKDLFVFHIVVKDMEDQYVFITGATSGIGKEALKKLTDMGATCIMLVRDTEKARVVREKLESDKKVEIMELDLSCLDSVRKASKKILATYDRIDVLINNAGVYLTDRELTEDGIEKTFAVNHLGHFLLTTNLLDKIEQSSPSKIINVSSAAHRGSCIPFDDINRENGYSGFKVYGSTKLANLLFTYTLAERLNDTEVTVNALHPGFVSTSFAHNNGLLYRIGMFLLRPFQRSASRGAEPIIYLATDPSIEEENITGKYWKDTSSLPFVSPNIKQVQSSLISYDTEVQEKLWQLSERLVEQN